MRARVRRRPRCPFARAQRRTRRLPAPERAGSPADTRSPAVLSSWRRRSRRTTLSGHVDARSRHPARLIVSNEDGHVIHLLGHQEPSRVGLACEQLLGTVPRPFPIVGTNLEGFLGGACPWVWPLVAERLHPARRPARRLGQ